MKLTAHAGMLFDENGVTIANCATSLTRESTARDLVNRYNLHEELVSTLKTIIEGMECYDESGFWPNDTMPIDLAKDLLKKVEESEIK